ncbi:hypothetical protein [Mycolicibacterium hippocampi]|nr:hypothetical protein [Mycolicibacterium hippocampi]
MANTGYITMEWDLQWHDEVDVVCADAGMAGLACAISAVDGGAEVLVAGSPDPRASGAAGDRPKWFSLDSDDRDTLAYLADLTEGLDPARIPESANALPIRLTAAPPALTGRRIPAFVGSRLRDWTARCIASPSGYLYTRVSEWTTTAMESEDGDVVEVAEIGSMTPDPGDVVGSVHDWLDEEAHVRGVRVHPVTRLDRLVFEQGAVIGAVFATPDGHLAVRARHGILLSRAGSPTGRAPLLPAGGGTEVQVALVSKAASRFGRVELLTSDPVVARAAAASTGESSEALEPA